MRLAHASVWLAGFLSQGYPSQKGSKFYGRAVEKRGGRLGLHDSKGETGWLNAAAGSHSAFLRGKLSAYGGVLDTSEVPLGRGSLSLCRATPGVHENTKKPLIAERLSPWGRDLSPDGLLSHTSLLSCFRRNWPGNPTSRKTAEKRGTHFPYFGCCCVSVVAPVLDEASCSRSFFSRLTSTRPPMVCRVFAFSSGVGALPMPTR
jgi:hypothetical protein